MLKLIDKLIIENYWN